MIIDPAALPARDTYRLMIQVITPRPIAWVSTVSPRGVVNVAPFSFFNGVAASPPTVMFSVVNRRDGSKKDTVLNVEATGEMVVNVVSHDARGAMNATSAELPYEESEVDYAGLALLPSERVRPPRLAAARVHMECTTHQIVHVGDGPLAANVIIARIVRLHLDDALLDAAGDVDPARLDTIGRLGGDAYARTTDVFSLARPRLPHAGEKPKTRP